MIELKTPFILKVSATAEFSSDDGLTLSFLNKVNPVSEIKEAVLSGKPVFLEVLIENYADASLLVFPLEIIGTDETTGEAAGFCVGEYGSSTPISIAMLGNYSPIAVLEDGTVTIIGGGR